MPREVTTTEINEVFEFWRARRPQPKRCILTDDRADLIRKRLERGYTVQDLIVLIEYAYESDSPEARCWRGDNSRRRTYLGLDNLLRAGKLADRIENAHNWRDAKIATSSDYTGPFRLVGDR